MANPTDNKPAVHSRKHIARLERERRQTRLILGGFGLAVVAAVGLLVYGYVYNTYLFARRPVARVGEINIPVGEWQGRVRMQRNQLIHQLQLYQQYSQYFGMDLSSQEQQIQSQLNNPSTMGQNILDQMINEELIRQEAAKRGITASTQEVDQEIHDAFQYYPSGTPTPTLTPTPVTEPTLSADTLALVTITPTPTALMTAVPSATPTVNPALSATPTVSPTATSTAGPSPTPTGTATPLPTATPYTLEGFQTEYNTNLQELVGYGLTESQVRQLYEMTVLRKKLFDQITADVPHVEDQVWARHILVADEATAKKVRQLLVDGEDFAKVATQYSTDTATKDKGGDLGWFGKGKMVPEFEAAAFSLKVGEISQPIKSQFGYHIIQVLAHEQRALDATAFDQAKQTGNPSRCFNWGG
ncbi:MAG: peptidylprolyl isomerase, partial [Anaerolineales bacterium]